MSAGENKSTNPDWIVHGTPDPVLPGYGVPFHQRANPINVPESQESRVLAMQWGDPQGLAIPGMSLRAYAAIQLRVPESGIDWLDAMIQRARRDDLAGQALLHSYAESGDASKVAAEAQGGAA